MKGNVEKSGITKKLSAGCIRCPDCRLRDTCDVITTESYVICIIDVAQSQTSDLLINLVKSHKLTDSNLTPGLSAEVVLTRGRLVINWVANFRKSYV